MAIRAAQKFAALIEKYSCAKKVNDSMQNVFAQPGFVFYYQIHYFAIDAQKNLGGG